MNGKNSFWISLFVFGAFMALAQPAEAANRYWIVSVAVLQIGQDGNWSNTNNWSTTSGGAKGASVPGSADTAIFDLNGDRDATVDASYAGTVSGLTINDYIGTITLARSLTVTTLTQTAATFNLGAQTLTVSGGFTLSGGTFTASTSTVILSGAAATVTGNITFYNLTISANNGATKTVADSNTLIVTNTLTLTDGLVSQTTIPAGGTIAARGNISQASTFDGGTGTIVIDGTASPTFTGSATTGGALPAVNINKTGGTLTLSGTIRTGKNWTYTAGTLSAGTSTVVFTGGPTITGSHTLNNVTLATAFASTTTIASGTTLTVSGTLTFNNGGSSGYINTGTIAALGDITVADAGDYSAGGGPAITINITGTGAQTFSGSATQTAGGIPIVNINKSSGTLTISGTIRTKRNWTYTAGTIAGTGTVVFMAGQTVTGSHTLPNVIIDSNSSTTQTLTVASGTTLTVSGTLTFSNSSTGAVNVNTGTLAAQGGITVANTVNYGGGTGTLLINGTGAQTFSGSAARTSGGIPPLTINNPSGTLTLSGTIRTSNNWTYTAGTIAGTETVVFVPSQPGPTITGSHTLPNVIIDSNSSSSQFLTVASGTTLTVSGNLTLGNSSTGSIALISTGTIAAQGNVTVENSVDYGVSNAETLLINGTGSQTLTGAATQTSGGIPPLTINKPSGTLTLSGVIRSPNNVTYTAGTINAGTSTVVLTAPSALVQTVSGSIVLANLTIDPNNGNISGGSLTIANGTSVTTTGTLLFQNSGGAGAVTLTGGSLVAQGNIRVADNVNYGGGTTTLTINGTGAQTFTGPASGTITPPPITVSQPSGGTVTLGSALNFSAGSNWVVNAGTTLDLAGYAFTFPGTLTNNGTILASGAGTPLTAGTFTSSNISLVNYTSNAGAGAVTMAPGTYGNLTVNKSGATFSLGGSTTVLGILTITAGTLDATTNNYSLTVSGNWVNNGIFNARAGTVTLNGTAQSFAGTTNFYNLTKLASALDILTFPAGLQTTVQGALTLQGVPGNPLVLRSSTVGIRTKLTLPLAGTQSLLFLDVQDSDASGGQTLIAYNSTDSGNNLNWSFRQLDLNAGLLSYWKFDNDTFDSVGPRHGTLNGASFTSSKAPTTYLNTYALSFNGSGNTVTASGVGLPAANIPISVGVWAKPTTTAGALFSLWNSGSSSAVFLFATGVVQKFSRASLVDAGGAPSTGSWHYYTYTYDGTSHVIYIDGVKKATTSTAPDATAPANVVIGNTGVGANAFFSGSIDDVRVYNRALSPIEVSALSTQSNVGGTGILTLSNASTGSTTITNTATVTAKFTNLETSPVAASAYVLSNSITSFGGSVPIPTVPAFNTTYTLPSGDGSKIVYAKITLGSNSYTITSNTMTLDTIPPTAPTNLTLTANSDNTGFTATVIAPSSSDVTTLYWRYVAADGNVAPTYPSSYTAGTALGAGVTTGVTANSSQSITVTSMTQLKTYSVAVWAADAAGNISLLSAQAFLYLAPPTPRLVITAATSTAAAQAGGSTTLTITAKDANNAVITTYAGPYTLTWTPTGGSATTLVSSSSSGWSSGVTTASVSIGGSSAGTGTFTATDNSSTALTNGTLAFTWYPASFTVTTDATSLTAGKPFTLTVTAKDSAGGTVTGYAGSMSLSISATPAATKSLSSTTITAIGGAASVAISYSGWASTATITASDTTYVSGVTIQGTSSSVTFGPAKFLVVIGNPPPHRIVWYVGETIGPVDVTAQDYNGIKLDTYRGTVTHTPVGGLTVPGGYTFTAADGGFHEFVSGFTSTAPAIFTLKVADASATSATGVSGPVTVVDAKVIFANVSGPVGTLAVPVRIARPDGGIVFGDDSTTMALQLTEEKANGSASVSPITVTFRTGQATLQMTDSEAETVTVSGTPTPLLPVTPGTVIFGSSSSAYSSSFQSIQFEQTPGSYTIPPGPYSYPSGYGAPSGAVVQGLLSSGSLSPAGRYDTGTSLGLAAVQSYFGAPGAGAGGYTGSPLASGYAATGAPGSQGLATTPGFGAFGFGTAAGTSSGTGYYGSSGPGAFGNFSPGAFSTAAKGGWSSSGLGGWSPGGWSPTGTSSTATTGFQPFSPAAFQQATNGLPPSLASSMASFMGGGKGGEFGPGPGLFFGSFGASQGGGREGSFMPGGGMGWFGSMGGPGNMPGGQAGDHGSMPFDFFQGGMPPSSLAGFNSSGGFSQGSQTGGPTPWTPSGQAGDHGSMPFDFFQGGMSGGMMGPMGGMEKGGMSMMTGMQNGMETGGGRPPWMEGFSPESQGANFFQGGGPHEEKKGDMGEQGTSPATGASPPAPGGSSSETLSTSTQTSGTSGASTEGVPSSS